MPLVLAALTRSGCSAGADRPPRAVWAAQLTWPVPRRPVSASPAAGRRIAARVGNARPRSRQCAERAPFEPSAWPACRLPRWPLGARWSARPRTRAAHTIADHRRVESRYDLRAAGPIAGAVRPAGTRPRAGPDGLRAVSWGRAAGGRPAAVYPSGRRSAAPCLMTYRRRPPRCSTHLCFSTDRVNASHTSPTSRRYAACSPRSSRPSLASAPRRTLRLRVTGRPSAPARG